MTMPEPLSHKTCVPASSLLAEAMCQVYLTDLTVERARELRFVHRYHHPDECLVHLEAAYWLLAEGDVRRRSAGEDGS